MIQIKSIDWPWKVNANQINRVLRHYGSKSQVQDTAEHLGMSITLGKIEPCCTYTIVKAKKRNFSKDTKFRDDRSKHAFLDISTLKPETKGVVMNKFNMCYSYWAKFVYTSHWLSSASC